ncbi:MAG: glycosyltransferase [Chromatiales bacterium]|nr:glycosyltransferase [Chromatiales bacterium]
MQTAPAPGPASLHILGSRQFGGADKFYVRLALALALAGDRVATLHRTRAPVGDAILGADSQVQDFTLPLANNWDAWSRWRIRRLVRAWKPRIVQTYMGRATTLTRLPADGPAVHIARLGGYYKIRGKYEHAHAWIGNTKGVCDFLVQSGLPAKRVFHIGNFVDEPGEANPAEIARLRQAHSIPQDAIILFTLGRFIDIKGFDDLLDAFQRIPREINGRPIRLLIGGDGPMREQLHKQCADLGLNDHVHWLGWVSDPVPWYRMTDIALVPSRHETLGNVILEAWSYGLPVLSTDNPGAMEIAEDGHDILIARHTNPADLAAKLLEMLQAPAQSLRNLADNGLENIRQRHGKDRIVHQYHELYAELLRRRGLS